jgi:hypothetical protein
MELETNCPYCGEWITLVVDEGGGSDQHYIEDCEVCCQPMQVHLSGDDNEYSVEVTRTDD